MSDYGGIYSGVWSIPDADDPSKLSPGINQNNGKA